MTDRLNASPLEKAVQREVARHTRRIEPHVVTSLGLPTPTSAVRSLWSHRELIRQLVARDVLLRYRGSYLGTLWTFLSPLILLVVFTLVFGVIFQARWSHGEGGTAQIALIFYSGLIVFNVFVESANRSPTLVLSNPNYVKKVVFPLDVLSIVVLGSALVHAVINLAVLAASELAILGFVPWTVVLLPIVLLPLLLMTLGFSWFLSALGVYVRDVGQLIGLVVTALMFLTPIFYPITAVPEDLRFLYVLNPMTYILEDTRRVLLWGELPEWTAVAVETALGLVVAWLGYAWFHKTRKGFADVL